MEKLDTTGISMHLVGGRDWRHERARATVHRGAVWCAKNDRSTTRHTRAEGRLAGRKVIDADLMGRAFPKLNVRAGRVTLCARTACPQRPRRRQMCTHQIYGNLSAPSALVDERGNEVGPVSGTQRAHALTTCQVVLTSVKDASWLERLMRAATISFGMTAALALPPLKVPPFPTAAPSTLCAFQHAHSQLGSFDRMAVTGSISHAWRLGHAILKARQGEPESTALPACLTRASQRTSIRCSRWCARPRAASSLPVRFRSLPRIVPRPHSAPCPGKIVDIERDTSAGFVHCTVTVAGTKPQDMVRACPLPALLSPRAHHRSRKRARPRRSTLTGSCSRWTCRTRICAPAWPWPAARKWWSIAPWPWCPTSSLWWTKTRVRASPRRCAHRCADACVPSRLHRHREPALRLARRGACHAVPPASAHRKGAAGGGPRRVRLPGRVQTAGAVDIPSPPSIPVPPRWDDHLLLFTDLPPRFLTPHWRGPAAPPTWTGGARCSGRGAGAANQRSPA